MRAEKILIVLLTLIVVFVKPTYATPLYVIKDSDGSVKFTNIQPKKGEYKVFSPSTERFQVIRGNINAYKSSTFSYRSFYLSKLSNIKQKALQYEKTINKIAQLSGLDSSLIKAVIHAESAFNQFARSPKGAMGLMQLMPGTAQLVGVTKPYEPIQNIAGGVKYLLQLLERYSGNLKLSLAAYNAGPGAVDSYGGIPPYKETQDYVARVLALHSMYKKANA